MPFEVDQTSGAKAPYRVAISLEGALVAAKAMIEDGSTGVIITDNETGEVFDEETVIELIKQQKNA